MSRLKFQRIIPEAGYNEYDLLKESLETMLLLKSLLPSSVSNRIDCAAVLSKIDGIVEKAASLQLRKQFNDHYGPVVKNTVRVSNVPKIPSKTTVIWDGLE